ncbi:MAG: hypothetical protein KA794_07020 [Candidatus Obscuribacter sp.]|nr:hypothetical protein [Candidatus Obscuribacter sp.]
MKQKHRGLLLSALLLMASAAPCLPVLASDPQVSADWSIDDPTKPAQPATTAPTSETPATAAAAAAEPVKTNDEVKIETGSSAPTFKTETPKAEPVHEAATAHAGSVHESIAAPKTAATAPIQAQATTTKLYGRIEQISGNGATFPIFKSMTPQLDTSLAAKPALKGQAQSGVLFSGTVAKSFPEDYRGNWGGNLAVWRVEQSPICFQIDPEEAGKVQKIFKSGASGAVNFQFANSTTGGIYLAPAQVLFQVAGKDVDLGKQMSAMMGGQSLAAMGPMGQMFSQMAQNMPVPVLFSFGELQTNSLAKGLSGNEFVQRTLKNQVRQLTPQVIEQDIVAEQNEIMKATGQPRKRYEESVLRFTKVNPQQMYVQCAQVVFGPDRKFQQKIIMYGYVTKGQVVNTNPYSGMMQMPGMVPGQSGASPFGGGGANPFGGGGANPFGQGGMPQLPPGFNPLQGLFGQ